MLALVRSMMCTTLQSASIDTPNALGRGEDETLRAP